MPLPVITSPHRNTVTGREAGASSGCRAVVAPGRTGTKRLQSDRPGLLKKDAAGSGDGFAAMPGSLLPQSGWQASSQNYTSKPISKLRPERRSFSRNPWNITHHSQSIILPPSRISPHATHFEIHQARRRLLRHPRPGAGARPQLEEEGHRIIKLNIGNPAAFGFEAPEEILQDVILNLPAASGYCDSKGLFAARKAVMHYTQQKHIRDVQLEDIYIGNGVSELIVMAMQALLNNGDEVLIPAPDYPLWTAAVSLAGGMPRHYLCDEQAGWLPGSRRHPRQDHAEHAGDRADQSRTTRPARCIRRNCCRRSSRSRASTS